MKICSRIFEDFYTLYALSSQKEIVINYSLVWVTQKEDHVWFDLLSLDFWTLPLITTKSEQKIPFLFLNFFPWLLCFSNFKYFLIFNFFVRLEPVFFSFIYPSHQVYLNLTQNIIIIIRFYELPDKKYIDTYVYI